MELYLFLAFVLMYILLAIFVKKNVQRKIWTSAFMISYLVTAISIAFLHVTNQDVMMSANQLNWYYLLYLFGSLSVVLGVINMWVYRKGLMGIFFGNGICGDKKESDEDDDDDDNEEKY